METKIAFAHPGRIGDALYCLPAIRWICHQRDCQADFYTSSYCAPMKRLVEYQSYINEFIILDDYVVTGGDCGNQPWYMSVPDKGYDQIYQLGFQHTPDRFLANWLARVAGAPERLPIWYDFPTGYGGDWSKGNYIAIAPRGETSYSSLFKDLYYKCSEQIQVVQIGAEGEGFDREQDYTGVDLLETLEIISHAKAFVGLMSANLVLANGFPDLPKFVPHDGKSWDMRHVLYTPNHHYLADPTPEEIMRKILGDSHEDF